ncbi:MAG: D-ribose pyranase [Firmicutes bacterium HGW-Firmicutes-7]|nr:MAG: D-ribose pyranase [Firmicutes bacterium HGW-Firmicutes-7]
MKKTALLNSELSYEISKMGHTDGLVICDSGLPIPQTTKRIDLAVISNLPRFIDVFDAIVSELYIEEVVIAQEFKDTNLYLVLLEKLAVLEKVQENKITVQYVAHQEFKTLTENTKCIVRTGECTPYANIILRSGVMF